MSWVRGVEKNRGGGAVAPARKMGMKPIHDTF
jgi:hypothetical protein